MQLDPKDLVQLQDAKEATYLEAKLDPLFEALENQQLAKLKNDFRSDHKSEVDLRVSVGILVAIEDLKNLLKQKINQVRGKEVHVYRNE